MPSPHTGRRLNPLMMATSITGAEQEVGRDRHHVGAGHHDLTDDGVAELDDRLDELALLDLDHLGVGGGHREREQVALGDRRALAPAGARKQHVRDADEATHRPSAAVGRETGTWRSARWPAQPSRGA